MKVPPQTKPALWGAAGGAIAWWIILAYVFNWTSAGSTEKLGVKRAEKAVAAALAPICAEKFLAQPDAAAKKAALAKAEPYKRQDAFPKEWVTLSGGYSPNSELVDACTALVLK
jgi:hypothetical protein